MVREDRPDGLHPLCSELGHQLADGGSEHLHHLGSRNGEADDCGLLEAGQDDLWCSYHLLRLPFPRKLP